MPDPPTQDVLANVLAAWSTAGQAGLINNVLGMLATIIPDFPEVNTDVFDGSAAVYLDRDGDADTDGICNIGEYAAQVPDRAGRLP